MYHPAIIAHSLDGLYEAGTIQHTFDGRGWPEFSVDDARAITADIQAILDPDTGQHTRLLTQEEEDFVVYSQLRIQYDAPFFLETFVWIDEEGHGLRPLYPLWDSQRFGLHRLADLQYRHAKSGHPDGLLVNALKARQVGWSTLGSALVAHRVLTRPHIRAISGSDTEEQASYLLRMIERIYEHLPAFLQPQKTEYRTGKLLRLGTSSVKTAWGKSTRGALQEVGGKKGNIERGRTNSVVHISELATWDNPEQLDTALMPGVPIDPTTLVLFESTAELAGDWWHKHWQACEGGQTPRDWSNLFMPWCVRADRKLPAPTEWSPSDHTLSVAQRIETEMPRYVGESVHLTRDQLYWYETTRTFYNKKGRLLDFYKEYPSNPQECFQYSGRSIFTFEQCEQIDQAARPLIDVWRVEPAAEIAALKRLSADPSPDDPKIMALKTDDRPAAPAIVRPLSKSALDFEVPPGYGFRRLGKDELDELLQDSGDQVGPLRRSILQIYEHPRRRGPRRYILGVDPGEGLGQDDSVIDVIREPTIEEPAEQVAQYVSNTVKPSQLAYIVDAIGRLYSDPDGIEACAAIELNNHGAGIQDLLQLHLGYTHFYVWEVVDAAMTESRFTKRIGWTTTTRTRPILLAKFHDAVTTLDPISGIADFRLNSPVTRAQLRHFITESGIGDAEHAPGQHDDAIFAPAIGYFVAHRMSGGELEPIADRRRRRDTLRAQQMESGRRVDFRNTDSTADEADLGEDDGESRSDDRTTDCSFFDPRDGIERA